MQLEPIDAIAEAIVGLQLGRVTIGESREILHMLVTGECAKCRAPLMRPRRFALDCSNENCIAVECVEARRRSRLIQDGVRRKAIAVVRSLQLRGSGRSVHARLLGLMVETLLRLPATAAQ